MLRSRVGTVLLALVATAVIAPAAQAGPLIASSPVEASTSNPLAACPADNLGVVFPDSEVEPWVDVNPANPDNIVGFYQQDRYSNGGSKGDVAAVSMDGGDTWTRTVPPQRARCTGPGDFFERATDPWVSFGPDGVLHSMSLVLNPDPRGGGFGDSAMVYNRSRDGGLTWEAPITLRQDTDPRYLNDKNSITADPNDANYVYTVWDRLQTARGEIQSSPQGAENVVGLGFKGPVWFARSTNGGDSFEPAHPIYSPQANNQTIGNQIVVRPQGQVIDFFNETNVQPFFRSVLSYIVSTDKGATWSAKATRVSQMVPMDRVREDGVIDTEPGVTCPDPGDQGACPIRTADILFDVAVNRTSGNLFAVWQDARPSDLRYDTIVFTQSLNGGQTWSNPVRVNLGSDTGARVDDRQAFTPSVHVADDGNVGVTFYDFRNNTSTDGILGTDQWAVHCHSNCQLQSSWGSEERITDSTFDMRDAPFARGWFLGDYEGLASDENEFISFFSQTHADETSAFFSRLTPGP